VSVGFEVPDKGAVLALDTVSLDVAAGEFVALLGPSGCGKTTILNMLAGVLRPSAGRVQRHGVDVTGPSADVGYMLARSALTPWRTARRNVELPMELRCVGKRERRRRAMGLLTQLKIDHFAEAYPSQLSHGMQQRVAIARTLAIDPDLWLMDEPFGALDAQTRVEVQSEFLSIWEGSGKTVLFVTHDLAEAVLLADVVVLMTARPGRIKSVTRIDIERPREPKDLIFDPRLDVIREGIWADLRDELA
jgi:NitT/TauT family transport system ATP-binding protein